MPLRRVGVRVRLASGFDGFGAAGSNWLTLEHHITVHCCGVGAGVRDAVAWMPDRGAALDCRRCCPAGHCCHPDRSLPTRPRRHPVCCSPSRRWRCRPTPRDDAERQCVRDRRSTRCRRVGGIGRDALGLKGQNCPTVGSGNLVEHPVVTRMGSDDCPDSGEGCARSAVRRTSEDF
jgi:hypothetical protein